MTGIPFRPPMLHELRRDRQATFGQANFVGIIEGDTFLVGVKKNAGTPEKSGVL